jgi:replicative DNA helicase
MPTTAERDNLMTVERAFMGAILSMDSRVIAGAVASGFQVEILRDPTHRLIAQTALDLWKAGKPIDAITVSAALDGDIDVVYLDALIVECPTVAHCGYYLDQLQNRHALTRVEMLLADILQDMKAGLPLVAKDLIAGIQGRVYELGAPHDNKTADLPAIGETALQTWANPDPEREKTFIGWPIPLLDQLLGRLTDEYAILAAQPSLGKTAFALQFACHAAQEGHTVSFASLESSREKVLHRLCAHLGQCHVRQLIQGKRYPHELERARKAVDILKTLPLRVVDSPMSLDQVRAWSFREQSNGSKMLIIDNLRHIRPDKVYRNRFDLFADLSIGLKRIRDDVRIPILALHHLSAEDKLAWSADIERDADLILVLSINEEWSIPPTKQNHYQERCVVNLTIQKNREGPKAPCLLLFDKPIQTFQAWESAPRPESVPNRYAD